MTLLASVFVLCFVAVQVSNTLPVSETYPIPQPLQRIDDAIADANSIICQFFGVACPNMPTIIEMDIALQDYSSGRKKRKAISPRSYYYWQGGSVSYAIDPTAGFTQSQEDLISTAISDIEAQVCVQFTRRTTCGGTEPCIEIVNENGCWSYVGRVGGTQKLSLAPGCRYSFIIQHEIFHALGMFHEQGRANRDSYLRILYDNVQNGTAHNFDKWTYTATDDYGTWYDYLSIMHYGPTAFGIQGRRTIETIQPEYQNLIGTSRAPSFTDIKALNGMYLCADHCTGTCSHPRAFMDRNCNCMCPGEGMLATQTIAVCDDTAETSTADTSSTATQPTTTPTTTTTTEEECVNLSEEWSCFILDTFAAACNNWYDYMDFWCPAYCGFCD